MSVKILPQLVQAIGDGASGMVTNIRGIRLRSFASLGVALLVHGILLFGLMMVTLQLEKKAKIVELLGSVEEEEEEVEELVQLMIDDTVELNVDQSTNSSQFTSEQLPDADASATNTIDVSQALPKQTLQTNVSSVLSNVQMNRPLAVGGPQGMDLGQNVEGLSGATIASGGDGGAVDQITHEILNQLRKSKVLVVWLMDASGSLDKRRETIINRFEKVYHELRELEEGQDAALLSGVVAFGSNTVFQTTVPTENHDELKRAVRAIKPDESGRENVFGAIKSVVGKWKNYSRQDHRKMMIVVLTDEIGDDPSQADEATEMVKRVGAPVYVLGPMAPFGRKVVQVQWTDPPTGERFMIPTERGPESAQPEHLRLPYWNEGNNFDMFASGFGPYALSMICKRTGGIYFMMKDSSIKGGANFDPQELLSYRPDYLSYQDYIKMMRKNPLRMAVVTAARESQGALGAPPTMDFRAGNLARDTQESQRHVSKSVHFIERALLGLERVERFRPKETSKRWSAHYDLMMGRLLAHKVRCMEYNWACADMKVNPQSVSGKNNAWKLVGSDEARFGKSASEQKKSKVRGSIGKQAKEVQADFEKAKTYLRKVMEEHPGTPWALMAKRELETPLGFKWQEHYIPPPPKRNSAQAKKAAEKRKKRSEAEKRVPKL